MLFCFLGPLFYHSNQTLSNPLNASLARVRPARSTVARIRSAPTRTASTSSAGSCSVASRRSRSARSPRLVAIVIGTLYGAISGLIGGFVDAVLMRFVDILLSIPFLLIVLVLATKYNGTVVSISLVLGVFSWLIPARLVRGEVLTLRDARLRASRRRRWARAARG